MEESIEQNIEKNIHYNRESDHEHIFIISSQSGEGKINIFPPFTFEDDNVYQICCQLTPIIIVDNQKCSGYFIVTTAYTTGKFIGGPHGYRVDCISTDLILDKFMSESTIGITITNNKLCIFANSITKCDLSLFATIKITKFYN